MDRVTYALTETAYLTNRLAGSITATREVTEQSVSALCGSLIDFTSDGSPILGPSTGIEARDNERRAAQDGVWAFQRQWNRYVAGSGGHWPDLVGDGRPHLANILNSALRSPTPDEAGVFGNWRHDDNLGSRVITRIVPDDLCAAVPYLSPNDLDDLDMRDAFWPALIAASYPELAALVRAKASGSLDPEAFEQSGEPVQTRLRFRIGEDEWHDGPNKRVRINHNGLSFARLSFTAPDTSYVSIAIPGLPAIVRVDWIEVRAHVAGGSEPRTLRWETAEDLAGLTFAECTWLGGNMVQFHAAHAAIWLPLAVHAGAPFTSVRVSIAFAMLPQSRSGLTHRMPPAPSLARMAGRVAEEYREKGPAGVVAGMARLAVRRLVGRQ